MKVLMFGWEYPPHVFGGLATANFGISEGLHAQGDVEITLCLPHPFGDESQHAARIVAMNAVPIAWRDVDYDYVKSRVGNIMPPELYYKMRDHIYADFNYMNVNDLGCMEFAGGYPGNLHEEINNYSIIAGVVARAEEFDIIHAHDWLTFSAGIHAKQVSGKPLCIHVHATEFDRSRGKPNPTVYSIEKNGMDWADCIMCVSELTRQTVINHYHQDPRKCFTVHNAVYPLKQEYAGIPRPDHSSGDKVVTFLGRITMQKGPEYFVEAANMVLHRTHNVRFCMAGSGDMMDAMIYLAAERGISDRFHFPGFMRGKDVQRMYSMADLYVMPSVSEPFGIAPLEALQCGAPILLSKQSGCAEVLPGALTVDYWDVRQMADKILDVLNHPDMAAESLRRCQEALQTLTWERAADGILEAYAHVCPNARS